MKKRIGLMMCTASLLFSLPSSAQVARLYNNQHGLETSNCYSVDIDSRGFVWVSGYSNKLGFFDGARFQYFSPADGGDGIFQIAYGVTQADENHYWVASSQGLYMLDARYMRFKRVYLHENEDSIYGLPVNQVIDYPLEDYKLITTHGFGTYVLNARKLKVDPQLTEEINRSISDSFVTQVAIDKRQHLWVATMSTPLICLDLTNKAKVVKLDYTPEATEIINNSEVTALLEMPDGILIGTTHGLLKYDRSRNLVQTLPFHSEQLYISALLRTHDQRILVGTDGKGIWEYTIMRDKHNFHQFDAQTSDFDITYGKVKDLKEDRHGNVIAMFLQKGLVIIPPQDNCFHYHAISPLANGYNTNCVTSMCIDKDENYWVGTDGNGVFTTDGMKLATARPVNEGLNSQLVQDVKIDRHGTVWAGTFGGGVQYYAGGRWVMPDWLSSIRQENVMTLHYDESEDVLFVGTNGNGIFRIDIGKQTVTPVHFPFNYNLWISSLLLDSRRNLWVATSTGLFYCDTHSGKQHEIIVDNKRITNASAIRQDGNNILIACDLGLVIYNLANHHQKLVSNAQALSDWFVRAVAITDSYYWIATRTHIASVDKRTYAVRNYTSFSGYSLGEFHRNSFIQPGHGYILFGGDNGIICFSPSLINQRTSTIHDIYFTGFSTPRHTEKLDVSIFFADKIELEHDNNSFTIEFSAVELGDPDRVQYEYLLEGHEKQWHTEAPSPAATYSSLPSGHYTFHVRAYPEDNPAKATERTIDIIVRSPWYASFWAYCIYFLLVCLLVYQAIQQLKIRRKQREQLRRTAEQDRMKEAKLKLFTSIAHELRSPLTMIESPLRQLMGEDKNPDHQSLYSVMSRNCDRLLNIVKQITDIRKIDAGQLTLHLEETNYVEYADRVFEQFKAVATVKQISFVVEHKEEELPIMLDTTHFEKIITNLLSNAFKFTPDGGKVIVRSEIVGSNAELRFYNSGSHFDETDLQHLWERFYQGSAGSDSTGSGIGLNLVYELVKLHHGSITANNIEPDGVEFTLHFPLSSIQSPVFSLHDNSRSSKASILVTDDDTELVTYIASQLEKDYNVISASSGNQAWKLLLAQRPDVLITDYRMPNGDGMELCMRVKNNPETENIPVIMLTGEGDETLQLHSLNIQVDHYLEKPVNIMLLRSAINQVLRVRERMRNKVRRIEMGSELPKPVIENADDKLFSRINTVIKAHLDDPDFTVQQLSEEVGISRVHLNRKMKERYGISPNLFINSSRLKQAAHLLIYNKVNVSEVAYKVGFSSHSYFTTSFHNYFGISPKEFVAFYSDEENSEALQKLLE